MASVKPRVYQPGQHGPRRSDDNLFEYRPIALYNLVLRAYAIESYQLAAPDWMKTRFYDIVAKLPQGTPPAAPPSIEARIGGLNPLAQGVCPQNRSLTRGESSMLIEANTLDYLARSLRNGTDRPVFDRTGLEGHFAIAIECLQLQSDAGGYPTMTAALKKLGLKLEARREEIEQVAVVSCDRIPAGNQAGFAPLRTPSK